MADLTSIGTMTKQFGTVWGNKRIWKGTISIGDGSGTWPSGGLDLNASDFGMVNLDAVIINGGTLFYSWDGSKLHAYTFGSDTGAEHKLVEAVGSTPNETISVIAIGTGGSN